MILSAALTVLALLSGADAESRIRWRAAAPGDSRRWVVSCNGSPTGPSRIGTNFALAHDYAKYCSMEWTLTKDKLGQIYTGGGPEPWSGSKKCFDATSSTSLVFPTVFSRSSVKSHSTQPGQRADLRPRQRSPPPPLDVLRRS